MLLRFIIGAAAVVGVGLAIQSGKSVLEILALIHEIYTPPPLWPIFEKGGQLEMFNEDMFLLSMALCVVFVIDLICCRGKHPFIPQSGRYFFIHMCMNLLAFTSALPDLYDAFVAKSTRCFSGRAFSQLPSAFAVSIHIAHAFIEELKMDDIVHHVLFVFTFYSLCIPHKSESRFSDGAGPCGSNYPAAILSGIPGAMCYGLLVLKSKNLIGKLTERKYAALINVWLRSPACVLYSYLALQNYMLGSTTLPTAQLFFAFLCFGGNGIFYSTEVVQSCAKHHEIARRKKEEEKENNKKKKQEGVVEGKGDNKTEGERTNEAENNNLHESSTGEETQKVPPISPRLEPYSPVQSVMW